MASVFALVRCITSKARCMSSSRWLRFRTQANRRSMLFWCAWMDSKASSFKMPMVPQYSMNSWSSNSIMCVLICVLGRAARRSPGTDRHSPRTSVFSSEGSIRVALVRCSRRAKPSKRGCIISMRCSAPSAFPALPYSARRNAQSDVRFFSSTMRLIPPPTKSFLWYVECDTFADESHVPSIAISLDVRDEALVDGGPRAGQQVRLDARRVVER
mmetsp:Transcript_1478/g.4460  ORF Transcript_1478/g.4460 Transcript_1478/m.4460 type:complete len:214 (-) Transcript_1478:222-863(-)